MIPEPQQTFVLELLEALGPAADDFVVAGAQAMKFLLEKARGTKDIDFVLDVVRLRGEKLSIGARLKELGYKVVEGSRNFQFEKPIPNSTETMRIEFMAPEEFKREKDFRVDVENGIHARALTGGSIAVAESSIHELVGTAVIFNYLVGNNDAHGKNYSLLYKPLEKGGRETRFSPLHDIVSTVYYPDLSRDMAMKIGKEYSSEKITAKDFEQLAEEAGLGKPLVRRRVPELAGTVIQSLTKVQIANVTAEKVAALIRERCEKARKFA